MSADIDVTSSKGRRSFLEVLWVFLRLGVTSFGGKQDSRGSLLTNYFAGSMWARSSGSEHMRHATCEGCASSHRHTTSFLLMLRSVTHCRPWGSADRPAAMIIPMAIRAVLGRLSTRGKGPARKLGFQHLRAAVPLANSRRYTARWFLAAVSLDGRHLGGAARNWLVPPHHRSFRRRRSNSYEEVCA
jgi:hypothetical protein